MFAKMIIKVYKTVIRDVVSHLKLQKKIHRIVRFVMYCFITTVPVECYRLL